MTSTLEDLTNVWNVIDDPQTATNIADTSKPASPQYTRTIHTADLISDSRVGSSMSVATIGGKNNDSVQHTIHWRWTLNGVEIDSSDGSLNIPAATPWWYVSAYFNAADLADGDVLGVKLWADAANKFDYQDADIYIIPRTFAMPAANQEAMILPPTGGPSGAISGVTYVAVGLQSNLGCGYIDTGIQVNPLGSAVIGNQYAFPIVLSQIAEFVNRNSVGVGKSASRSLAKLSTLRTSFRTFDL